MQICSKRPRRKGNSPLGEKYLIPIYILLLAIIKFPTLPCMRQLATKNRKNVQKGKPSCGNDFISFQFWTKPIKYNQRPAI